MKKTMIREALVMLLGISTSCAMAATLSWEQPSDHCQILDTFSEPVYDVSLGYVPKSRFEGYGKSALLEPECNWAFAYLTDVALGDIDLNFRVRSILFLDSAELQLPDQVAKIAIDAGWTWRYQNGMAIQFRIVPGIYSDLEEINTDIFFVPFSCSLIRAFNRQLSGIVGAELRPGFEREIMPLIGLEWEINDALRLEARLPESRFIYFISPNWSTYLGFDWQNTSFKLSESDRDLVTIEDFRACWGLTHWISDQLHLTGEVGHVFDRSIEFKGSADGPDSEIDIESDMFVRFGLGGPF